MTWEDALEIVVMRTNHPRFRDHCAEANTDIEQRDGTRSLMIALATGQPSPPLRGVGPPPAPPPPVPLAASIRATKLGFHRCWFATKDTDCGCSGVRCHLKGQLVTLPDCIACLS